GGGGGGCAGIVAKQNWQGIGGGGDDGDGFDGRFQRQRASVVLEQDDGLARGFESELAMGGSVIIGDGELRPGHGLRRVKHAETEACFKETLYGAIDIGGRKKTVRN